MYSTQGRTYNHINNPDGIIDNLPAKVFSVEYNPLSQSYYLERQFDSFKLPSNLYNCNDINSTELANLFVNRYTNEGSNLGVLLSGLKGTGKSMLLKQTANLALSKGLPVLLVEQSFSSSSLTKFLSSITEDCVILFDEFEKYYYDDSETSASQNELLSFFDGTSVSHKLIIMTVNDQTKLSQFFINRPSRIRYVVEYTGLSQEFVKEYVANNLIDKSLVKPVLEEFDIIDEINFDLLNVCCDEVNKSYPALSIKQIFRYLNIQSSKEQYVTYGVKFYLNEKLVAEDVIMYFDFNDFNSTGGEKIPTESFPELDKYLEETYNIRRGTFNFNRNNTTAIKGRSKMESIQHLSVLAMDKNLPENKQVKPELEFRIELDRVKFSRGAF